MKQWMCSNKPTEKCKCYHSCRNIPTIENIEAMSVDDYFNRV